MTEAPLARAVARVEATTLAIGTAGAIYEFVTAGWRAALALAIGAVISWLNYRWLRNGVMGFTPVAAAESGSGDGVASTGSAQAASPAFGKVFLKFFARIALLLVALYVILSRSLLPSTPLLAGLFASVAAVILQTLYAVVGGDAAKSG